MAVDRLLPSQEAAELIELTREIADKVLDPIVDRHEKDETYPEGVFEQLGAAGLLSLPQPEEWGGGGQPYEVDRKSTRLNSSHVKISYAVFCLKKKTH